MSIHVRLNPATRYRCDRPAALSPQAVRLRPVPHCRAPIHACSQTDGSPDLRRRG